MASLLGLAAALVVLYAAIVHNGLVRVPLPHPAVGKYVHMTPSDVLPWKPRALEGVFAPNERLKQAVRLFEGQVWGSESLTVTPDGRLIMLDRYNNVLMTKDRALTGGEYVLEDSPAAHLGPGRPLGAHLDKAGNLVVCDSLKGLVMLEAGSGNVVLLTSRVSDDSPLDPGSDISYANDLDIADDGRIYFTACTDIVPARNLEGYWDTFQGWSLGLAQGAPRGQLLGYSPATRKTHVLVDGLYYANGVALAPDGSYVLVAETDRLRVLKYWLQGPQAGTLEVVIDHLPGVPDGVDRAADGGFWVSLVAPVPPIAKLMGSPLVRALFAWLPKWAKPPIKMWGAIVKITPEGEVQDFLMDADGSRVFSVSSVSEHDGRLWLGNLVGSFVSYIDLPQGSSAAAETAQKQE